MATRKPKKSAADRAEATLAKAALEYPEAWEDHPWGERAIKVRKKIFAFVNRTKTGGASVTIKLPESSVDALLLAFTEPTHYGMGKYGWVTCRFEPDEEPPIDLLLEWIEESYRAIAPKTLVAKLDAAEGETAPVKKKPTRKPTPRKKVKKRGKRT